MTRVSGTLVRVRFVKKSRTNDIAKLGVSWWVGDAKSQLGCQEQSAGYGRGCKARRVVRKGRGSERRKGTREYEANGTRERWAKESEGRRESEQPEGKDGEDTGARLATLPGVSPSARLSGQCHPPCHASDRPQLVTPPSCAPTAQASARPSLSPVSPTTQYCSHLISFPRKSPLIQLPCTARSMNHHYSYDISYHITFFAPKQRNFNVQTVQPSIYYYNLDLSFPSQFLQTASPATHRHRYASRKSLLRSDQCSPSP